ncbi:hypothetical protein [Brachybacterium sp. Z12]|uniref:hypothetical protein n=1 Tax=Brachybacterium sp. Z12 TaxID=2759167 RepID=UPI00223BBD42|nr:hypothetical protein [Brachybacterium sp. Z12]
MSVLDGIDGSSATQAGIAVLVVVALITAAFLVLRRTGMIRRGHSRGHGRARRRTGAQRCPAAGFGAGGDQRGPHRRRRRAGAAGAGA